MRPKGARTRSFFRVREKFFPHGRKGDDSSPHLQQGGEPDLTINRVSCILAEKVTGGVMVDLRGLVAHWERENRGNEPVCDRGFCGSVFCVREQYVGSGGEWPGGIRFAVMGPRSMKGAGFRVCLK